MNFSIDILLSLSLLQLNFDFWSFHVDTLDNENWSLVLK